MTAIARIVLTLDPTANFLKCRFDTCLTSEDLNYLVQKEKTTPFAVQQVIINQIATVNTLSRSILLLYRVLLLIVFVVGFKC